MSSSSHVDLTVSDFDFELPEELIAQEPAPRGESRLLVCGDAVGDLRDLGMGDLPDQLGPGDLLVVNDTRVLAARLRARRLGPGGDLGGACELLLVEERGAPERWATLAKPAKRLREGTQLQFVTDDGHAPLRATVEGRDAELVLVRFSEPPLPHLDSLGEMPLPPYIRRPTTPGDRERYQTIYGARPGAIAAPTAGLHFDDALLQELERRGVRRATVTLHVGLGTFRPMTSERIDDHNMHSERYDIPEATVDEIRRAQRVVAVGTTVVRALEGAALSGRLEPGRGATDVFIRPGFRFRVIDLLLTNFHLPRSTLLLLVSAFAGREQILTAYRHAIEQRYRFFSYGDAMLLAPRKR